MKSGPVQRATLTVEIEQEEDGRWLAEVPAVPGAMAYGATPEEAKARAEALVLRALAERLEHGEPVPEIAGLFEAA
jgi:predicted RNase H-like HicB family nuclease